MKHPKLKARRVELGITQKEMADRLGITATTYSFKETGKRDFALDEIAVILNILDCKFEDIFLTKMSHK